MRILLFENIILAYIRTFQLSWARGINLTIYFRNKVIQHASEKRYEAFT